MPLSRRRPRRRTPSGSSSRHDDAGPVLRALAASVYAPTAVFAVGSGAIQPVLVLAAMDVGMSRPAAALVIGLLGVVGVVSAPVAGGVVARVGGRRAMAAGTVMAVVAAIGILIAMSAPSAAAVAIFVVGVVLQAVAANLWALARQGYVADAVPPWARARALSFLGGMMRLGVLVGPAIGSLAILAAGRRGPFAFQIVMVLGAMWLVLARALPSRELRRARRAAETARARAVGGITAPSAGDSTEPARTRVDLPATAAVAVAMTCLQLLRTNRTVLVPLWGAHLGLSDILISATFAAGALVDVAMFLPSGRWMDRHGRLAGILPALFLMGASLMLVVVWTSPIGFVVSTCLMGFGNGFGSGIVMTMGADLAPTTGRERFLGWWQGIGNIGAAAGPFVVSTLTATLGLVAGMRGNSVSGRCRRGVGLGGYAPRLRPRRHRPAGSSARQRRSETRQTPQRALTVTRGEQR